MATFKATSEDTGGAYTITEETWPPQVGPPPHIHHTQEETFYILEGEMEFVTDGITTRATTGSLVRIPRGVLREYSNVGPEPARVLVLFAPGGFEGFFEEVGEPVTSSSAPPEGPPDVERLVAIAAKYGSEIPPLTSSAREERGANQQPLANRFALVNSLEQNVSNPMCTFLLRT
jgi:quercetin dioxygenase-like cupin family protein